MEVIMPELGDGVTEGIVTRWCKKVGEHVRLDEILFEVETDKISQEVPSCAEGVLTEILVEEGTTAEVGARLAVIRESDSASTA